MVRTTRIPSERLRPIPLVAAWWTCFGWSKGAKQFPAGTISGMLKELYKEIVLDHYERPRHRGELEDADLREHLLNPLCGDEITVYARFQGDNLAEVGFTGRGCSISQASASMLAERLSGRSRGEAEEEIEAFLEMMRTEEKEELGDLVALKGIIQTPNRIRCATLAWTAFKQGLDDHKV